MVTPLEVAYAFLFLASDEASMVTGTNLKHANLARAAGIEYTPKKGYGWWAAKKDKDEWSGPSGSRTG